MNKFRNIMGVLWIVLCCCGAVYVFIWIAGDARFSNKEVGLGIAGALLAAAFFGSLGCAFITTWFNLKPGDWG